MFFALYKASGAGWADVRVRIPKDMVLVASDFDSLGELILSPCQMGDGR